MRQKERIEKLERENLELRQKYANVLDTLHTVMECVDTLQKAVIRLDKENEKNIKVFNSFN